MTPDDLTKELALAKQTIINLGFELIQTNTDLAALHSSLPVTDSKLETRIKQRLGRLKTIVHHHE